MGDRAQLIGLTTPFPAKYVKEAPGGHGNYVSHDIVTQRLLRVLGPFTYTIDQTLKSADGTVEGCVATLTVTIDGKEVSVSEAGECDNPSTRKTQGDRLKNASSDAIKRCAMRLGLGLHVWAEDDYFLHGQLIAKSPEDNRDFDAPDPAHGTEPML